ncbi:MAG: TRAM domain-containing protein [archaeon]
MYDEDEGFRRGPRRTVAPVNVGDEMDVTIEAVGEKGDGIAKKNGFVLFIPNTNKGDQVKIRVTKVLKRLGFADVVGAGSPAAPTDDAEDIVAEETDAPEEVSQEDSEDFGDEADETEDSEEPSEDSEDVEEPKKADGEDAEDSDEDSDEDSKENKE